MDTLTIEEVQKDLLEKIKEVYGKAIQVLDARIRVAVNKCETSISFTSPDHMSREESVHFERAMRVHYSHSGFLVDNLNKNGLRISWK